MNYRLYAYFSHIRLNIQRISFFLEEIMRLHVLIDYMDSMMNVFIFILYYILYFIIIYCLYCVLGKRRYSVKLWKLFSDCFNCLPLCAV